MTVEARDHQSELAAISSGATAAGLLLALGVLAMTVGLIRSEAVGDLRTLTASGATGATRRTLTAATGGALALLGALLGPPSPTWPCWPATRTTSTLSVGSRSPTSPSSSSASPCSPPPVAGSWPAANRPPSPGSRWNDARAGRRLGRGRAWRQDGTSASSRSSTTAATLSAASNPTSTTSWKRAAASGLAPPNRDRRRPRAG